MSLLDTILLAALGIASGAYTVLALYHGRALDVRLGRIVTRESNPGRYWFAVGVRGTLAALIGAAFLAQRISN